MWFTSSHSAGPAERRDLVGELQRSHRAVVVALGATLLLAVVSSGYLILVSQPRVAAYTELTRQSRLAHEAMLNEETGLRGWLATDNGEFLEPYAEGLRASEDATSKLVERSLVTPEINRAVLETLLTRQAWQAWAEQAATTDVSEAGFASRRLEALLLEGKQKFDAYRSVELRSTDAIVSHRDQALAAQKVALIAMLAAYLVVLAAAAVLAARRKRRLERSVLQPVRQVLETIDSLRSGDLSARSTPTGLAELDAVGAALDVFAADLHQAGELASAREYRSVQLAKRLETVIKVAQETSGSLSIRDVSETITSAAASLLGVATTLWVRGEDSQFHATRRSQDPHGAIPPPELVARHLVTSVAADARAADDGQVRAFPMVLAGTVVGVLEAATPTVDADTEHVLGALLSTGAAALESAHLHSAAREQADVDALTRLPNRRRLEPDLEAEWERSRRYGRALSFAMIDLDHFKRLNDEHGHPVGDTVLRAVAAAITATLRITDSAYRYGGEEIGVLLRETDLAEATIVGERLRVAIAAVTLPGSIVSVTASVGVAERVSAMSHHSDIIAQADLALYEAKRAGRDRVIEAPLTTSIMTQAPDRTPLPRPTVGA
ncbi:MAG: diguanylate cyclase [Nocardioidaceae bacterium]|nr:diguanylate cyclase [Nocardioidaceae bacterium]